LFQEGAQIFLRNLSYPKTFQYNDEIVGQRDTQLFVCSEYRWPKLKVCFVKYIFVIAAVAFQCYLADTPYALAESNAGIASVYSNASGNWTANGNKLNSEALTAAHRTLPFGTKVRVTNKSNGRSVIVTINDRGPFVRGRVIDVTPAAARALGFSSLTQVTLDVANIASSSAEK
jgi:rare lipoprotein A